MGRSVGSRRDDRTPRHPLCLAPGHVRDGLRLGQSAGDADDPTTEIGLSVWILVGGAILLFGISSLYHIYPLTPEEVARWGRIDHSAVFIFIATNIVAFAAAHRGSGHPHRGHRRRPGRRFIKLAWPTAPPWVRFGLYFILGWAVGW